MHVFVTGATGYIGSAVVDRLRAAGHEVSGLARSEAAAALVEGAGGVPVRGDLSQPDSLGAPAQASDGTISLATSHDPAVDRPAIDAILDALAETGKPFVYTSGVWCYGDTGGAVVDETTPPRPVPVVQWRQAIEERVLASAGRDIRAIVIRSAIAYGRGGGIPAEFVRSAREEGAARYVGTGENRWPFVHVDDLADLYLAALERAPPGLLVLAVSGPSRAVRDVAAAASRGAGAGGRTVSWPLAEARRELGEYADALVLDQQASGRRARETLGWRPHRPDVLEDLERGSYTTG